MDENGGMGWLLSDYGSFPHSLLSTSKLYCYCISCYVVYFKFISQTSTPCMNSSYVNYQFDRRNVDAKMAGGCWRQGPFHFGPHAGCHMLGMFGAGSTTFGSGNHPKHSKYPTLLHCLLFFLGFLGISLLEKDSISLRVWRIGSLLWVPFTKSMAVECQVLRQVRNWVIFSSIWGTDIKILKMELSQVMGYVIWSKIRPFECVLKHDETHWYYQEGCSWMRLA